jgi:hypothetical protein
MTRRLFASLLFAAAMGLAPSVPSASAETPCSSAPALTCSPWWGVTSSARPTALRAGAARDEVQEIIVAPESIFTLEVNGQSAGFFESAPYPFGAVPHAEAAVVQQALEGVYGAGNVLVTGGPGGAAPLIVTSVGEDADRTVPPVSLSFFAGAGEAKVVTAGHGDGEIAVQAQNLGDIPTGGTVTVTDRLPPGVEAVAVEARAGEVGGGTKLQCTLKPLACTDTEPLPAFEQIEMRISVVLAPGAESGGLNTATVSGGGAAHATSASRPIVLGGAERFGFDDYRLVPENAGGSVDTQAGSHPFQLSYALTLNTGAPYADGIPKVSALAKDIADELPAGLIGNPTPFAQCTDAQFSHEIGVVNECPAQTAVGVATITFTVPVGRAGHLLIPSTVPIFNVTPRAGEPARFGFKVAGKVSAFLDASVRTGGDYGVTITSSNIIQAGSLLSVKLTFWGVPGDPRHDHQRGWECLQNQTGCAAAHTASPPPFLAMPTSCAAPFQSTSRGDSWAAFEHPSVQAEPLTHRLPERVDGCNHLPFSPEVKVTPDGTAASSPTGLNVDVHVPQFAILNAESLAQSAVKNIEVALPAGVAINPAGGDGLQACSEGLVGFEGLQELQPSFEPGVKTATFSSTLPEPLQPGLNFCADASKIGTVEISTPLLPAGQHVKGSVYLASQNENPFGSLIALYLVAKDPVSGFVFKSVGETKLNGSGQIIGTFKNNPQLAFEDAELHFFGGERAPLATPARCGAYTTNATFTPWSGNESVSSSSTFNITSGPNGSPCPGPTLPFSPSLTAGTTNINAGAFSQFTLTMGRADGQQALRGIQTHMPPGLSGLLSGVKLCAEQQANEGTCGPESMIGEDTVSAGVGNDPITVPGAKIYITGPYHGAPFGLSIVNPAKSGPFDLEHDTSNPAQQPPCDCVVDRARIEVDPTTAALTVTTNTPQEGHAIPQMIDGIPLQLKHVNVTINRPGFIFNPTNCSPMSLTGDIAGDEGGSSSVSVPFQIANCANLKFTPKFTVSTSAKTSKALGASLTTKVEEPKGSFGTQANITKVKVDLPIQLPSQLKTLQKACLAKTFEAGPASCPKESFIGHAKVITPLLPVPLEGPAIFVSHGGEAFPSLEIVLQGYGVTVDLVGSTFISKAGITSTTFKTVPDTPFNTFELTLPQGKYSALAAHLPASAHGNMCGQKLKMPTLFVAQNGLEIHQQTPITVTGCAKHKMHSTKKK